MEPTGPDRARGGPVVMACATRAIRAPATVNRPETPRPAGMACAQPARASRARWTVCMTARRPARASICRRAARMGLLEAPTPSESWGACCSSCAGAAGPVPGLAHPDMPPTRALTLTSSGRGIASPDGSVEHHSGTSGIGRRRARRTSGQRSITSLTSSPMRSKASRPSRCTSGGSTSTVMRGSSGGIGRRPADRRRSRSSEGSSFAGGSGGAVSASSGASSPPSTCSASCCNLVGELPELGKLDRRRLGALVGVAGKPFKGRHDPLHAEAPRHPQRDRPRRHPVVTFPLTANTTACPSLDKAAEPAKPDDLGPHKSVRYAMDPFTAAGGGPAEGRRAVPTAI